MCMNAQRCVLINRKNPSQHASLRAHPPRGTLGSPPTPLSGPTYCVSLM
jgi:hypothetical protein